MMNAADPIDRRGLTRRIRAILWSEAGFALLARYGCGWNDGGCRIAAEGLARWLGQGRVIWALLDSRGRAQHLVLRIGRWYLDADGVSSEAELIARWAKFEGVTQARLAPAGPDALPGTPRDEQASRRLAELLEGCLRSTTAWTILDH
jgi:hypothetical protein